MPRCRDCDAEVKRDGDMCASCTQDYCDDMEGHNDNCECCGGTLAPDDFGDLCRKCDFLENECGMMPDGYCSMAGSEDCDWRCPRAFN